MDLDVSRAEIEAAAARIEPWVRPTPMLQLGDIFGGGYRLSVKLEHLQVTGSFKARGAFSLLTTVGVRTAGVAAASGGNFGIAVSYACSKLGYPATIFVPETSPAEKIHRIEKHGADVRVVPGYYHQALEECERWAASSGAYLAHAYDQAEVVAGQGTVGLEIMSDMPETTSIIVAVGGGGLIGGIAAWCRDDARVVSAEPRRCASMYAARTAGGPTRVEVGGVAASSLGAESIGEYAWYANQWIDDAVLVTDDDIVAAQSWLWREARLAVEPAAATTIAVLAAGAFVPQPGDSVVAVLSGGNVDLGSIG